MCDRDRDGVVDVSWQPGFVSRAVAALAQRTRTWVYVSSCPVYAAHDTIGADASADLLPALEGGEATMATYGEVLDVRDLASWLVHCIEVSAQGTFNARGPMTRFADHLDVARRVTSHIGPLVTASSQWLTEHEVNPLEQTLADVLDWEVAQGPGRDDRAGLSHRRSAI